MARRKAVEFNFGKAFAIIEELEKNKEKAVEEAIMAASKIVQEELDMFAESKKETGYFHDSLKENPKIEKDRGRIEMVLGFDKTKPHGRAAYFWNKGSPTTPKTMFINKAFRSHRARNAMKTVLKKYWEDAQKAK